MPDAVTIENAYCWLNEFDKSHLSSSNQELVAQMSEAIKTGQYPKAWTAFERLKGLSRSLNYEVEIAEILVECGRAAYEMGYWDISIEQLEGANSRYSSHQYQHQLGVVQWMLGYVLWSMPTRHTDGIVAWQNSLETFEKLVRGRATPKNRANWYREKVEKMKTFFQCALENDCLPPSLPLKPPPATSSSPGTANPAYSPTTINYLRLFAISDIIPAGGFGPVGSDPHPIAWAEVDQVIIDDRPHHVVGIKGQGVVKLHWSNTYGVLKVKGDSMNKVGIDDGDYVLLRLQKTADNNDIVAAAIIADGEQYATLKRFLYIDRGTKIVLQPCSYNTKHHERVFAKDQHNVQFVIEGVVEAVFKS